MGFFRSLVPATKKESIFTKEGIFGCDVFNLRFWKLRRSTLLREVVVCGSGDTAFSQKTFDLLSGREKQVDFSSLSPKAGRCFQMAKGNILYKFSFFKMCRSCSSSFLIEHSRSSWWLFSVVLLEDVIVEDWGGFTNSFPREGPGIRYCDQILTCRGSENAGTEAAFFVFWLGCCSGVLTS